MKEIKDFKEFNDASINEQMKFQKGYYISIGMTSQTYENVRNYFRRYLGQDDTKGLTFNEKQHITIIYDNTPRNDSPVLQKYKAKATFDKFALFGKQNNVLVAKIKCPKIVGRNAKLSKDYGFKSDFGDYEPHFTLSYTFTDIDIKDLPPMNFPLEFELETLENLAKDWDQSIN